MAVDLVKLSKTLSHALRHAPEEYDLFLDDAGWVPLEDVLYALRERRRAWRDIGRRHLDALVEHGEKQRFEIEGDQIRARYGHSLKSKIRFDPATPPDRLFHGTAPKFLEAIESEGLTPQGRQYVHLSTDVTTAIKVGKRRCPEPEILVVDAAAAHRAGQEFYPSQDETWLTDSLAASFLSRLDEE